MSLELNRESQCFIVFRKIVGVCDATDVSDAMFQIKTLASELRKEEPEYFRTGLARRDLINEGEDFTMVTYGRGATGTIGAKSEGVKWPYSETPLTILEGRPMMRLLYGFPYYGKVPGADNYIGITIAKQLAGDACGSQPVDLDLSNLAHMPYEYLRAYAEFNSLVGIRAQKLRQALDLHGQDKPMCPSPFGERSPQATSCRPAQVDMPTPPANAAP